LIKELLAIRLIDNTSSEALGQQSIVHVANNRGKRHGGKSVPDHSVDGRYRIHFARRLKIGGVASVKVYDNGCSQRSGIIPAVDGQGKRVRDLRSHRSAFVVSV
jgi:hypothetical protein